MNSNFLTRTAIVAAMAISPMAANALDVNNVEVNTTQTVTGNNELVRIGINGGSGRINTAGQTGLDTSTFTGIDINVDTTTGGIASSGGFTAIGAAGNATTTINTITITDGLVTSDEDGADQGTIDIGGATSSPTITIGANGSVTNTAAGGGNAINFDDANGAADYTITINNAGNISTENVAGATSIELEDNGGGSSLDLNNTGTINSGALGQAIQLSADNSLDLDNTGSGAITGAISTSTGTTDILNADTATINGNITTTSGPLTLNITGGTVTGNVTNTSGTNNIDVNGGSLIGNVGLGSNATGTLDVTTGTLTGDVTMGNAAQVFTYTGGTFTGDVNGAGQFHIDGDFTTDGTKVIGGVTPVTLVEVDNGATLTVGANIAATDINLNVGTIDLSPTNRALTGNLSSANAGVGKLDVNSGTHTLTGAISIGAGDTIDVDITTPDDNDSGSITAGGAATVAAGALLEVDLLTTDYIAPGTTYSIIDGTGGTAVTAIADGNIDVNGSGGNTAGLLTFSTTGGEDLTIVVGRQTFNALADDSNSASLGAALETIGMAGTDNGTEVEVFIDAIQDSNSTAAANRILESGTPETDNSLSQGIFDATTQSVNVVGNRLSAARSGGEVASLIGLSAGNSKTGRGAWIQAYGGVAEQDTVNGVSGYDADTYGLAIGADKKINNRITLGLSGSVSQTNVDSNSGLKETDVDSYQLNAYGSWDHGKYYVDGIVGVAHNEYESTRTILAPASTAQADFNGQTYVAQAATGYTHALKNGIELNPNASLTYAHNRVKDYSETGAGAMNLAVDNESSNRLEAKLGINAARTFQHNDTKIRPELRLAVAHDFIGDEQQATSNFQGIPTTFRTNGMDIEQTSFEVGAGVDLIGNGGVTLSADYDLRAKSDYSSHIGSLKIRYDF